MPTTKNWQKISSIFLLAGMLLSLAQPNAVSAMPQPVSYNISQAQNAPKLDGKAPARIAPIGVLPGNVAQEGANLPTNTLVYAPAALEKTLTMGTTATDAPGLVITNTSPGDLTFELVEQHGGFVPVGVQGGGPDPYGYTWLASNETGGPVYNWIDATGGTALGLADDGEANITSPFAFPFYGTSSTALRVGNNGGVLFNATAGDLNAGNYAMNNIATPNNSILAFWDDIDSDTGNVYWMVTGSAPNRRMVVEWYNRPHYSNIGSGTFELVLFEDGDILYQYQDLNFGNASYNYGASATVGIRGANATNSLQYSYNQAILQDNFAICFDNPGSVRVCDSGSYVPWLTETPITGTVSSGASMGIDIGWDASVPEVDQPGTYTATLAIINNDPMNQEARLPVTLNVLPAADFGKLEGVVSTQGYCNTNPSPLEAATVVLEGSLGYTITLETDASGYYQHWLDMGENPYHVTASMNGYGTQSTVVNMTAGITTTQNFALTWLEPCAGVNPASLSVSLMLGTITNTSMTISNDGGAPLNFVLLERQGVYTPLNAPTAGEDVLVVRHDTTAANAMQSALTSSGYTFLGVTDAQFQAMPVSALLNYLAVFHAGPTGTSSTPGPSELLLMAYMDAGGSLYISDNDLGYWRGSSTFYQTYLQATFVSDDPGIDPLIGQDIMAGLTLGIGGDPYPDDFTVRSGGVRIFQYTGGNAAGVRVNRMGYRAIYTSVDFQYMGTAANQIDVISRVMQYLGVSDVPWLSESPITGTLPVAGDQLVNVTFNTGIPEVPFPGTYAAQLIVRSNDPFNRNLRVPVEMHVTAPAGWGELEGTVNSLGLCDTNPAALSGATLTIEGGDGYTYATQTNAIGYYHFWIDTVHNPITVTVTGYEHISATSAVTILPGGVTHQSFGLRWLGPCVSAAPEGLAVAVTYGVSTTLPITLSNTGAVATGFTIVEQAGGYNWLSEEPFTGMLPADNGVQVVAVTFDSSAVPLPGVYEGSLSVVTDDLIHTPTIPVTLTVNPNADFGMLMGTITGLGYCDEAPAPLEGADILIESAEGLSYTVTADANGDYMLWLPVSGNTYTVTVTASDYETGTLSNVTVASLGQTPVDFELRWPKPCIRAVPSEMVVDVPLGYDKALVLDLLNGGAVGTRFRIREQEGHGLLSQAAVKAAQGPGTNAGLGVPASQAAETGIASKPAVIEPASGGPAPEDIGNAWETMAPLPEGRVFSTVVADQNGYVYVIGGTNDAEGTVPTNTNFRYDTAANTWSTMAPIPATLYFIDGIAIDNKIYIPGDHTTATTYVYDIDFNTWSTIAANGGYTPRDLYQVAAIGTDLYVLGGVTAGASTTQVWVLDTAAGTWTAGVPMLKSRASFSAGAIDGVIYVAGGVLYPAFTPDMTAEKFDGTSWSYIAPVPDGGGTYTSWSFNADGIGQDGLWLGAGLRDAGWAVLNHAGYYNPDVDTWTVSPAIPTLAQGRVYMEGDVATDGYFYVIGGCDTAGITIYATNERLMVGLPLPPVDVPWLAEEPIIGTIPGDSSIPVDVTFTAFPTMTVGNVYTASLLVRSDDPVNPRITIPVTMNVVLPVYGVEISADQAGSGGPGEMVDYSVTVTNTSNFSSDSFTLTLGTHAYATSLGTGVVGPLPLGESASVNVSVTIPQDVVVPDQDVVQVTATSHGNPALSATTTLTTQATGVYGVNLEPEVSAASGDPGNVIVYTLHLTNTGTTTDTIQVSVAGTSAAWATLPQDTFELAEGEEVNVFVMVVIPVDAAGGEYPLTVTAASTKDPSKTDDVEIRTTVVVTRLNIYLPIIRKAVP